MGLLQDLQTARNSARAVLDADLIQAVADQRTAILALVTPILTAGAEAGKSVVEFNLADAFPELDMGDSAAVAASVQVLGKLLGDEGLYPSLTGQSVTVRF